MDIVRKARGTKIPKQAQRVFLSCDKNNENNRSQLISDLLSMDAGMDCVVSYYEANSSTIDEKLLRNELLDTQVFVLWVTTELLQSAKDGVFPIEYHIAKELHTPILPIASDGGLFPRFTEIAGAVHGIAMTDVEYRSKLKMQLESFLVSDESIGEIQSKAFTSAIFLSYRKMDIENARHFMKSLHNLGDLQAISIWYDNFLTAGRNFDDEIKESIIKSDLFVLLVTPNLATQGNYVQTTEYPFARQERKAVLSAEAVTTDSTRFATLFPHAEVPVRIDDSPALHNALITKLGESACIKTPDSERNYLLGLAYLKGFGVEKDFSRGVHLLEDSATDCCLFGVYAAKLLAGIYEDGYRTTVDLDKVLHWRTIVADYCDRLFGMKHDNTASAYRDIATAYRANGKNAKAIEWYQKALKICESISRKLPVITDIYYGIATAHINNGDTKEAIEYYKKALKIRKKLLGKEHIDVARTYNAIGTVYKSQGDARALIQNSREASSWYADASFYYKNTLSIYEKLLGTSHPETALILFNIGTLYCSQGNYSESLEFMNKAISIAEKAHGRNHPIIAGINSGIAFTYWKKKDAIRAIEFSQKALTVLENILGINHPDTALCYGNIGTYAFSERNYDMALDYYQKTLDAYKVICGEEDQRVAAVYTDFAMVYGKREEYAKSVEYFLRARFIFSRTVEKGNPLLVLTNRRLGEVRTLFINKGGSAEAFREIEAKVRKDYHDYNSPLYFANDI